MRREMSDMQAELLALREQQRRARQPRPEARIPDHQDAFRDADKWPHVPLDTLTTFPKANYALPRLWVQHPLQKVQRTWVKYGVLSGFSGKLAHKLDVRCTSWRKMIFGFRLLENDTAITKAGTKLLLHRAHFSCSWDILGISTLKASAADT
ncbi:hypothetical protein Tco_1468078 [Tanacetum coccineum]